MLIKGMTIGLGFTLLSTGILVAQETQCEARGHNGMVTLVLCPSGLDQDAWKDAGVAACGDRLPCGAWIWQDEAAMPTEAPDAHDKLAPEQVRSAVAIWVSEAEKLLILDEGKK